MNMVYHKKFKLKSLYVNLDAILKDLPEYNERVILQTARCTGRLSILTSKSIQIDFKFLFRTNL
ncbi:hypothetical protein J6590_004743 [Homalodisca vitripennis]|nr:hypothetical protein J6590_004743 [Homalodisca vitripennis]